jgi:hypothetical protein
MRKKDLAFGRHNTSITAVLMDEGCKNMKWDTLLGNVISYNKSKIPACDVKRFISTMVLVRLFSCLVEFCLPGGCLISV